MADAKLITRTLFDVKRPEWLDSDMVRLKTAGVTLDAGAWRPDQTGLKIVPSGTPVGKNTQTGLYVPADGTQVPAEYLTFVDVDLTDGNAEVACMDWGRVIAARLPVALNDAIVRQLSGITFVGYGTTS